jgi:hypothetical protein
LISRYLLPNPLIVCAKKQFLEDARNIIGKVTVCLVNEQGADISESKRNFLQGSLMQQLNSTLSASFSLKVRILFFQLEKMIEKLMFIFNNFLGFRIFLFNFFNFDF